MMYTPKVFDEKACKISEFTFWFHRETEYTYKVTCDGNAVGTLYVSDDGEEIQDMYEEYEGREEEIFDDFDRFKSRPESAVGEKFYADDKNIDEMINLYEELLLGTAMIRNFDKVREDEEGFIHRFEEKCLRWLRKSDFYQAPASTVYHESCVGGLLHHSLRVLAEIYDLASLPKFNSVSFESMTLVALTHDWCKIGLYNVDYRNAKNDDGVWEKVPYFKRNNNHFMPLGHGVTSMYEVQKFFSLSLEEACAIRHHMGVWNCHEAEYNDLQEANHRFPLVHMLQFADQLSIVRY